MQEPKHFPHIWIGKAKSLLHLQFSTHALLFWNSCIFLQSVIDVRKSYFTVFASFQAVLSGLLFCLHPKPLKVQIIKPSTNHVKQIFRAGKRTEKQGVENIERNHIVVQKSSSQFFRRFPQRNEGFTIRPRNELFSLSISTHCLFFQSLAAPSEDP